MWPYIALVSLVIFWIGLAILLTKWPRFPHKSISQHSAASKESYRFFTLIQSSVGVITYVFMVLWFIPTFNLPLAFTMFFSVVAWLQIVSSFIPDTGVGRKSSLHAKLAYSFALGIVITSLYLSTSNTLPSLARILFAFSAGLMLYTSFSYLYAKKRSEQLQNYLMFQVIYIVSFQVSILAAAFLN